MEFCIFEVIEVATTFQLGPNLPKKGIYSWKQNKHCVVNINSTDAFKHFEDLKDLIFFTFWKKNWSRLASWALFILQFYKAFETALYK